jgi:acyl-CoA reductase-like NAD-dependent aldehyde dehydrogenase
VDHAVAAAKAAQPAWAAKTFTQRADILACVLERVGKNVEDRAVLFVRENGKTISEARAELTDVAVRGRFTLELAAEFDATRELPAPKGRTLVRAMPFWSGGVDRAVERSGIIG